MEIMPKNGNDAFHYHFDCTLKGTLTAKISGVSSLTHLVKPESFIIIPVDVGVPLTPGMITGFVVSVL